jgi:hypothetical protein
MDRDLDQLDAGDQLAEGDATSVGAGGSTAVAAAPPPPPPSSCTRPSSRGEGGEPTALRCCDKASATDLEFEMSRAANRIVLDGCCRVHASTRKSRCHISTLQRALERESRIRCRVAAGSHPARGPHQIRTRRFPPSGSSAITSHGRAPQMRTMMRGRGSPRASSLNRAQVRRQRLLRRRSHLNHALLAQWFSAEIARPFPLTAK